jgi:hypothetical protein
MPEPGGLDAPHERIVTMSRAKHYGLSADQCPTIIMAARPAARRPFFMSGEPNSSFLFQEQISQKEDSEYGP